MTYHLIEEGQLIHVAEENEEGAYYDIIYYNKQTNNFQYIKGTLSKLNGTTTHQTEFTEEALHLFDGV
ncbi:hypothetical protein [Bacillus ndiopicus]|uniref:hypothetical protein n=1 Tax=Bacillus ndiopicus TaxID=1347368 RepID=UPI0005AB65FB|nr:hypothetical protein [Bacillus ndiopicus]